MFWNKFCSGAYQARALHIDAEACINLFPETLTASVNEKKTVLYGTPGLRLLATAAQTIGRGQFTQDGRTFTVIGTVLYELTLTGAGPTVAVSVTARGSVATDGLPVFFASNGLGGKQLLIASAGQLYVLNLVANTLSVAVTLPLTNPCGRVVFLNGYFLLVETSTLKVWYSALEDGTTWPGLNFFARSNLSDNVIDIMVLHDQLKVFGSVTSEWFYDSGDPNTPFIPYPGAITMDGAVSAFSDTISGETIVWLAKNGQNVVRMMASGVGEASVISTPAVEFALASYATVADAEVLAYEQEGHAFVAWTFPTADVTWVYDLVEHQWHQRAGWDNTNALFHRWRARGCCAPGSQCTLVGDALTGAIYALSLDVFTDNTTLIKRLRRAPYLSTENQWLFLDQIELGLQAGVGCAAVPNPQINLRLSRDFGNTYSALMPTAMGASGVFLQRAIWRRLARVRADQLVIEVSQTDAVRAAYGPGIFLRTSPGSGQL